MGHACDLQEGCKRTTHVTSQTQTSRSLTPSTVLPTTELPADTPTRAPRRQAAPAGLGNPHRRVGDPHNTSALPRCTRAGTPGTPRRTPPLGHRTAGPSGAPHGAPRSHRWPAPPRHRSRRPAPRATRSLGADRLRRCAETPCRRRCQRRWPPGLRGRGCAGLHCSSRHQRLLQHSTHSMRSTRSMRSGAAAETGRESTGR